METRPEAPLEHRNVYAAIGAGNISQSLLIKIAGGGVSGVFISDRSLAFGGQSERPQSFMQELVRLHQEEMLRYQQSYNTASNYLDQQINIYSGRVNGHIAHLSEAEKEELFDSMDDVIENPNDDYYLSEYNELATDLNISDRAALIVDYDSLKKFEQNRALLNQSNPENVKAEDISEASIKGIDSMHEGNKQIVENRNQNVSQMAARFRAIEEQDQTLQSRSSLAQSIDDQKPEVSAQGDFKAAVNDDQSGLDIQPLAPQVSLNGSLTP